MKSALCDTFYLFLFYNLLNLIFPSFISHAFLMFEGRIGFIYLRQWSWKKLYQN
jgi:hypothetical protein